MLDGAYARFMEQMIQKEVTRPNGGVVTVELHGEPDAEALVIVPGVMSDARAWRQVAAALTAWPTVVVVNRRGRTPSSALPEDYSLRTEIDDVAAVLGTVPRPVTLFGWSYGGLIALAVAAERPVAHLIGYEPVMAPFAAHALADLRTAEERGDHDRTVEIICRRISGMTPEQVRRLSQDRPAWETMRRLAAPVHAETRALNDAALPRGLAGLARRVDLLVGEQNRGRAPYGTSFGDVRAHVEHAEVHELPGQGHMAHLEDPAALARRLDSLA